MHPAWQIIDPDVIRFIRFEPESNYNSQSFIDTIFEYKYGIEKTPRREKHANGVAERKLT